MENHEQPYRATFPVDEISKVLYEYNKKKNQIPDNSNQSLDNKAYGLNEIAKEDERILADEIDGIEHQIAEREKIKQGNIRFLEEQMQKLGDLRNRLECFGYRAPGIIDAVRGKLATELIRVELKKGEEYVNAFRDVQRLEEQKRERIRGR
jgi:vacuolar-type H+-ATPase subunit I/STV1